MPTSTAWISMQIGLPLEGITLAQAKVILGKMLTRANGRVRIGDVSVAIRELKHKPRKKRRA